MTEILNKLKQKEAVVSKLQEEKVILTKNMGNPELINGVNSKIDNAKKETERIKNIVDMTEQGEIMDYKKSLKELRAH